MRIARFVKLAKHILRRRPWAKWTAGVAVAMLFMIIGVTFVVLESGTTQHRRAAMWTVSTPYWKRARKAMERNFDAYWNACAGRDEYEPVTGKCDDWLHVGATAVDSTSRLLIMGLKRQYHKVRAWAAAETRTVPPLRVAHPKRMFLFEQIIRTLGGLTSAYALAKDEMWLTRAR